MGAGGEVTRVNRRGNRAKHSFTITPSTNPEHSDASVVTTGHSDICHQIRADCRPWHSPLPKALSHHLFPKGKTDGGVEAYTGKDGFQSHQKRKPMKVVANLIRTKTLLSGCLQSQAAGVRHQ